MEQLIIDMISQAERTEDYDLVGYVKRLISEFTLTINCPSNWRSIGETLLEVYEPSDWVYEELELWNYED